MSNSINLCLSDSVQTLGSLSENMFTFNKNQAHVHYCEIVDKMLENQHKTCSHKAPVLSLVAEYQELCKCAFTLVLSLESYQGTVPGHQVWTLPYFRPIVLSFKPWIKINPLLELLRVAHFCQACAVRNEDSRYETEVALKIMQALIATNHCSFSLWVLHFYHKRKQKVHCAPGLDYVWNTLWKQIPFPTPPYPTPLYIEHHSHKTKIDEMFSFSVGWCDKKKNATFLLKLFFLIIWPFIFCSTG